MEGQLDEDLFFSQKIVVKKKFGNDELLYFNLFLSTTHVAPENILCLGEFIFFFVKNEDYFEASRKLSKLRRLLKLKKILIIRTERLLNSFILSFFPDPYIYDLELSVEGNPKTFVITAYVLSFEERGIAIGRGGDYIKILNTILEHYVDLEKYATYERYHLPLKLRCKTLELNYQGTSFKPVT